MGNCQAVDTASLVVQHPSGRSERMYRPITASEIMKANPGHHVSLIIPLPLDDENRTVRFTKVKLLRPSDVLVLGRAYRLVKTQDVVKVLREKKHAKMKKMGEELAKKSAGYNGEISDRHRARSSTNLGSGRIRLWRPSLQSITEGGS